MGNQRSRRAREAAQVLPHHLRHHLPRLHLHPLLPHPHHQTALTLKKRKVVTKQVKIRILARQQNAKLPRRRHLQKVSKKRIKVHHGPKGCQRIHFETLRHLVIPLQQDNKDLHDLLRDALQAEGQEADLQTLEGGNSRHLFVLWTCISVFQ